MDDNRKPHKVQRTALRSSRQLDYCTVKNLTTQIGHGPDEWPLVVLKELLDNALDACDESHVAPEIWVTVDEHGITVTDNGPGIPPEIVEGIIDFDNRVSTREAYASCDRGAQGQAWKTLLMMHYALTEAESYVEIAARGVRHRLTIRVDRIQQRVVVEHAAEEDPDAATGTTVHIGWPNDPQGGDTESAEADEDDQDLEDSEVSAANSSRLIVARSKWRFLQVAEDFAVLNPHLTLSIDWHGVEADYSAIDTDWDKWRPCDPVSAHWFTPDRLGRLVAGYIGHEQQNGHPRTVRQLIGEFHGLAGTQKHKAILEATDLSRKPLSALAVDGSLDSAKIAHLLAEMQRRTRQVNPMKLGPIGKDNLAERFEALGCDMESYRYQLRKGYACGVPYLVEVAFAWNEDLDEQRLITGIHWSPTLGNPFRKLGKYDEALDALLEELEVGSDDPVMLLVHLVHPGVSYSDQGKSAVLLGEWEEP